MIGHASVVQRRLLLGGRALRTPSISLQCVTTARFSGVAANPWSPWIRGTFSIPDGVQDGNVTLIIARQMLKKTPYDPQTHGHRSFSEVMRAAAYLVSAFLSVAASGDLDLPLCGFGNVSNGIDNSAFEDKAEDTALQAIVASLEEAAKLEGANQPSFDQRDIWIRWLWQQLAAYVKKHPNGDRG